MGKKPTAADANFKDGKLHEAARSGDMATVQAVCSANPLAVNSRDRHSRTPAVKKISDLSLLENLNSVKSYVIHPLNVAIRNRIASKWHAGKYYLEAFLSNVVFVKPLRRYLNYERLHLAAWSGHAEVVSYLCKNKADIGAAAMDDMGAIHFAAQKGHLEVIKILYTSGVSIKSYNRKGMAALHYAAQGSHLELVKYLVKKGANLDAKNKAGKTALDLASIEEVRNFLVEWKNGSGKSVGIGGEKRYKGEQESAHKETTEIVDDALDGDEIAEDENDKTLKRKGVGEIRENQPEAKKSKVPLNHLLAADDTQEDEEDM